MINHIIIIMIMDLHKINIMFKINKKMNQMIFGIIIQKLKMQINILVSNK